MAWPYFPFIRSAAKLVVHAILKGWKKTRRTKKEVVKTILGNGQVWNLANPRGAVRTERTCN